MKNNVITKLAKRIKFWDHPFYVEVREYVTDTEIQQIEKGAEKYVEPFNPDSWSGDELSDHAMQEARDLQVYITGLRHHIRKVERQYDELVDRYEADMEKAEAKITRLMQENEHLKRKVGYLQEELKGAAIDKRI